MSLFRFLLARLSRSLVLLIAPAILAIVILVLYTFNSHPTAVRIPKWDTAHIHRDRELVVAAVASHNTTWLQRDFPDWNPRIYVADNAWEEDGVPAHKGREAMVYLTYIIDNYYNLPNLMIFLHGRRWQWHNDDPEWDSVSMVKRLQIPYLLETGYVNLRCHWEPNACPSSIHTDPAERPPLEEGQNKNDAEAFYSDTWRKIFPNDPLPKVVGQKCCAQFAVTKERVHRRKPEDYERIRNWLLKTPIRDSISGRILEYSWHILFGSPSVNCPVAKECYCKVYNMCDLNCPDDGNCDDTWKWPDMSLKKVWLDGPS